MATTVSSTRPAYQADISLAHPPSGVRWPVRAVLVAATCVLVGVVWDISWHMSIGRDTLWSPPHLVTYAAGLIVGITCGWLALHTTFRGTADERGHAVAFWGFRAPLGAWICIWGAFAMLASAPFDDWWHQAYGLDVKIISPPHVVLALGMYAVVVGAMVMTAAARSDAPDARTRRRLEWGLVYALGVMLSMVAVFTTEYSQRGAQHASLFYRVSAMAYPVLLCGAARASGLRWSATRVAAVYMAVRMLQGWILPLVPAEPKLGPIFYPMTHLAALEFPLLLVVPALGVDWLVQRPRDDEARPRRDLLLAPLVGVAFVLLLLAAQWPFATFLHSPAARNWFFFADQNFVFWGRATSLYRQYRFFPGDPSTAAFLAGIGRAVVFATLSAFVGLSWGRWLRRVRR
jgi:hypothetical protein